MFAASKTASVSGGYQISRSLRFNSADSTNVQRTFSTTGTSQTTSTLSMWFKRGDISRNQRIFDCYDGSSGSSTGIFLDNDVITLDYGRGSGAKLITTQVLRDVSAWYHLVAVFDSSNATSSNRLKLYLNGSQITTFSTAIYPSQNALNNWMSANSNNRVGSSWDGSANFSGYITEVNFIDGQALTPSSFGETNAQTGVWQPKAYSGSYGTNGFYLNFSDNSNTTAATLGKDYSGNGNNWTPNNFSVTAGAGNDSLVDSPTSYGTDTGVGGTVRGNYCTLNPLSPPASGSPSYANGNLDGGVASYQSLVSTFSMTSGQWYWEVTPTGNSGSAGYFVAVSDANYPMSTRTWQGANFWGYYQTGSKYTNGGSASYGASFTTNDVIGVALDMDAGTVTFYKNGVSQGVAYSSLTGKSMQATVGDGTSTSIQYFSCNFGQRPFAYTAPSGYKALCTQNLPTPTIGATTATQAGKYFNPVLYTGNGGTQSVTGVGFQPDFVWVKNRSAANGHGFEDVLRGAGYTLASDSTSAEINYSNYFTAFTSDGFNMALGGGTFNGSGSNYVAWNWKANGSGSTNTAGSITSTVSANTTSGFSIVTYTGNGTDNATIGHGLGVAPSMIIVKSRSNVTGWPVWQGTFAANDYMDLQSTGAKASASSLFGGSNASLPTSTVFKVGANGSVNASSYTYVAYCFAEVAGYSKFGSYTGNGSSDGPFVFTGFRPAYLLVKRSDAAYDWWVFDSKRLGYNVTSARLSPDLSDAEYTTGSIVDFTSNGFKIRDASQGWNGSGGTIIYMAFAENPFKYSLAR